MLSIEFTYLAIDKSFEGSHSTYNYSQKGPYVLKAGDAIPVQLQKKFTANDFRIAGKPARMYGRPSQEIDLKVRVHTISSFSGFDVEKEFTIQKVRYDPGYKTITFPYDTHQTIELHELADTSF